MATPLPRISAALSLFFSLIPPPPRSTLFPYTTLFRSGGTNGPLGCVGGGLFGGAGDDGLYGASGEDRKSTRLNSSHVEISYAVFCLKKKNGRAARGVSASSGHGRHSVASLRAAVLSQG